MAMKKKAPPAEKENGERWLVSYSDFVTLLLGVFIIMYSMAAADAEKAGSNGANQANAIAALASAFGNSVIEKNSGTNIIDFYTGQETLDSEAQQEIEEKTIEEVKEQIENLVDEFEGAGMDLDDSLEVIIDELGIHIRIKDTVLFESAQYEITDRAKPLMLKIGDIIKRLPNNKILVKGHTDSLPINKGVIKSNWELGALRAVTVTKLLIGECALNPTNISAITYGEFQPIATNLTEQGRSENRRVEITILRNYIDFD